MRWTGRRGICCCSRDAGPLRGARADAALFAASFNQSNRRGDRRHRRHRRRHCDTRLKRQLNMDDDPKGLQRSPWPSRSVLQEVEQNYVDLIGTFLVRQAAARYLYESMRSKMIRVGMLSSTASQTAACECCLAKRMAMKFDYPVIPMDHQPVSKDFAARLFKAWPGHQGLRQDAGGG